MNRRSFLQSSAAALSAGAPVTALTASAGASELSQAKSGPMKFGVPVVSGPMDSILLKDYDPQSSLIVPVTKIDRARFPVIDVHTHSYMCEIRTREDAAAWVRTMDEVGIETSVVFTDAIGEDFDRQAQLFKSFGKRFVVYCSMDVRGINRPDYSNRVVRELERCVRTGARGLGEITDKGWGMQGDPKSPLPRNQRMHPDDPRLDALWQKCADLHIPVNIHIADHPSCWQPLGPHQERTPDFQSFNLYGKDVPSYNELLAHRNRMLANHPRTTFIAAHLGNQGNDLTALGQVLDRYPNLWVDISARDYEVGREPRFALKFITHYQDRILFGTDMGRDASMYRGWWRMLETADEFIPGRQWWRLYGLEIPGTVLEKLYTANARRILNWS
ncbi:MAG TPA: amidohydrolase family protein [Bryobacteraceae bacterium]|jgi:predicted TIM-barrel fold metal-dependent hydrolase